MQEMHMMNYNIKPSPIVQECTTLGDGEACTMMWSSMGQQRLWRQSMSAVLLFPETPWWRRSPFPGHCRKLSWPARRKTWRLITILSSRSPPAGSSSTLLRSGASLCTANATAVGERLLYGPYEFLCAQGVSGISRRLLPYHCAGHRA